MGRNVTGLQVLKIDQQNNSNITFKRICNFNGKVFPFKEKHSRIDASSNKNPIVSPSKRKSVAFVKSDLEHFLDNLKKRFRRSLGKRKGSEI